MLKLVIDSDQPWNGQGIQVLLNLVATLPSAAYQRAVKTSTCASVATSDQSLALQTLLAENEGLISGAFLTHCRHEADSSLWVSRTGELVLYRAP